MRVSDLACTRDGDSVRVSASITWEDCDRPQREIYIETHSRFADDLKPDPNAFLLAAILPAMRHDERRILVEGSLCPQLRDGLLPAMAQLREWYGEAHHHPVAIEATQGFDPPLPRVPPRVASLMSGGIDSIATLRANRLSYPVDHPGSIRDCIYVHGVDVGGYEDLPDNLEHAKKSIESLSKFAAGAEATLIPVFTNMRHLDDDDTLFAGESHSASFAAIAQAFSRRITRLLIPSSLTIAELKPWGSHPALDLHYSSAALTVQHDGLRYSRLEKVELVAGWDEALQTLRSCFNAFRPDLNCGECEKCLRTMTGLLVLGKLKDCSTYRVSDLTPDLLQRLAARPPDHLPLEREKALREFAYYFFSDASANLWRQMLDPLRAVGRPELVAVIEQKLQEFDKYGELGRGRGWKGAAKRFDKRFLGGTLSELVARSPGKR